MKGLLAESRTNGTSASPIENLQFIQDLLTFFLALGDYFLSTMKNVQYIWNLLNLTIMALKKVVQMALKGFYEGKAG